MNAKTSDYSLIIIGSGAAGIGASQKATQQGINHLVLEASHRIGGRGLTELLGGYIPVDLGCHWMHCASQNPFVKQADHQGFHYQRRNPNFKPFINRQWQEKSYSSTFQAYIDKIAAEACLQYRNQNGISVWECFPQESLYMDWASYWLGLMHSNDPDQVSIADIATFDDTNEDWPVQEGYGALIAAVGNDVPTNLNCIVKKIIWHGSSVTLETSRGTISADKVIVTVSTGILDAGDILFDPVLPDWKLQAIHDLPMGNYNYLFFSVDPAAIPDAPSQIAYQSRENSQLIRVRPFDYPYISGCTAGRFAWWLEKQGEQAAEAWFRKILVDIFGSKINQSLGVFKSSAWGYDPWIRGAYSSLRPGCGSTRTDLIRPIDSKVYFAGEAASESQFNTAHGAWLSGQAAVSTILAVDGAT